MKYILFLKSVFFIPHYIIFRSYRSVFLKEELGFWIKAFGFTEFSESLNFFRFIVTKREYRTVFYHRIGWLSVFLKWYAHGESTCYIETTSDKLSVGLIMQHGHSTQFFPESSGSNCQVWHNVTVGRARSGGGRPIIKENVKISTGAIIIGPIVIGNNVTIAAGSVVTKNVPDNCVVVGNPGYIIKKDGERVVIKL